MSEPNEAKLLESLIWSTNESTLSEFVEKYQLPQVVCVEVGFFGNSESTTLSGGQVLTLHALQETTKVVCESPYNGVVVIPLHCPLKFRVLPKDCDHASVTAEQLATVYRDIKYIRVVKGRGAKDGSLKVDDILKVQCLDTVKGLIKCTNVAGGQKISVPFNCDALFSPLLGPGDYTLAEVKQSFGFPAKVCLSDKNSPSSSGQDSSMAVSSLGTLTVYDEIKDYVVISTTLCGSGQDKMCLQIPKDLEITVVVAEGFLSGNETYQRVVKTLDKSLNKTSLSDFKNLDVYEHLDVVKNTSPSVSLTSVEKGSARVQQLVMEHRSSQFTDVPSPKLPPRIPRKPSLPAPNPTCPPRIPPKPSAKPAPPNGPPKAGSAAVTRRTSSKQTSRKSLNWLHFNKNRHKSEGDEPEYVEVEATSDHVYEGIGNYTALDPTYESTESIYQEPLEEAPKGGAVAPVRPSIPPPRVPPSNKEDIYHEPLEEPPKSGAVAPVRPSIPPPRVPVSNNEAIYQALARIPQDLSPLTTTDVGKLLTYLGMECYVRKFAHELIDGDMLLSMDRDSLESLDLTNFHTKKLLKFIGGWRPNV